MIPGQTDEMRTVGTLGSFTTAVRAAMFVAQGFYLSLIRCVIYKLYISDDAAFFSLFGPHLSIFNKKDKTA